MKTPKIICLASGLSLAFVMLFFFKNAHYLLTPEEIYKCYFPNPIPESFGRVVRGEASFFGQVRIDFTLRNVNLGVDFTFAQTLGRDFVADLIAERVECDAIGGEALAQLFDGHSYFAHFAHDIFLLPRIVLRQVH